MKQSRNQSRAVALLLAVALMFGLAVGTVSASTAQPESISNPTQEAADKLYTLGLFQGVGTDTGGTPDFALDRIPTRNEAITMLVRLLGKEAAATSTEYTTPFDDVTPWVAPYVGYAYENGLTTGTSANTFGGGITVTATQYLTFVLRALGYRDGVDFAWNSAWTLSDELGITAGQYNENASTISRGNVAQISFAALSVADRTTGVALYEKLIAQGVFTAAAARSVGLIAANQVTALSLSRTSLDLEIGKTATLTATLTPADADDKTVTWDTSDSQVATVSAAGVVTAVGVGSATITASSADGPSANCTVTVTEPQAFSVPLIEHEYGPMTLMAYYSTGNYWSTTRLDSLVFTKAEPTNIDKYKVFISAQGYTDYSRLSFEVHFYDAKGRVLDQHHFLGDVPSSGNFNTLIYSYVDYEVMDNAVRIEFFSYTGEPANATAGGNTGGNTGGGQPGTPDLPDDPPQVPAQQAGPNDYADLPGVPDFEKYVTCTRLSLTSNTSPGQSNNAEVTVSGQFSLPGGEVADLIQPYINELVSRGFSLSTQSSVVTIYKQELPDGVYYVTITDAKAPGGNYVVTLVCTKYKD